MCRGVDTAFPKCLILERERARQLKEDLGLSDSFVFLFFVVVVVVVLNKVTL